MGETAGEMEVQTKRDRLVACFNEDSGIGKALASIPEELQIKDETELARLFNPTPLDYAMKKNLWTLFYEAEATGFYKLKGTDVYGGVCSNSYFYNQLLKNSPRVAWLFTPTIDTEALIEEAYRYSFQRVRDDILSMPVTEKTAPILLKAFQYFADRHLGPMVHKIESRNLNVEVQGGKMETPTDPREIEAKLKEIRAKLQPLKDVTPQDE